jgi:histidinol phosphatase-like PHP family hydrolase
MTDAGMPDAGMPGAPASAAWRPRDCHAHTTFSDGTLSPEALVAIVAARGARPTVADHCSRDVSLAVKSVPALEGYVAALERVRAEVPDLAVSGEFCWHDDLWLDLPPALWRRFTHAVGSLHAIVLPETLATVGAPGTFAVRGQAAVHMFQRPWPDGLAVDAYMDAHVATLERFAREMPVDILAHPTLLPLALRSRPLEELWTEPREERAVHALAAAGIAFEVSNRYRPHERFVRRAVEAGVRLSLGSDGHTAEQVGDVAWPLALARASGAHDAELYDPLAHGRRGA